jgi:hypothetical protein
VEDGGLRRNFRCVGGIMFGSEARQIRHGISVRLWSRGGNQSQVATFNKRHFAQIKGLGIIEPN